MPPASSGENRQYEVKVELDDKGDEVQDEWSEWYSGDAPVQHDAPMQDASTPLHNVEKRGGVRLDASNAHWGQKLQHKAKGKHAQQKGVHQLPTAHRREHEPRPKPAVPQYCSQTKMWKTDVPQYCLLRQAQDLADEDVDDMEYLTLTPLDSSPHIYDDPRSIEAGGDWLDYHAESSDDEYIPPCRMCHVCGPTLRGKGFHYCLARQAHDLLELDRLDPDEVWQQKLPEAAATRAAAPYDAHM